MDTWELVEKTKNGGITKMTWDCDFKWTSQTLGGTISITTGIIFVTEFMNRYGFSYGLAYPINKLKSIHSGLTKEQGQQILLMAVLQVSVIQFRYVVDLLIEDLNSVQTNELHTINLFRLYQEKCIQSKLVLNGGPFWRFWGQPTTNKYFTDDDQLKSCVDAIGLALEDLDDGRFLNPNEDLQLTMANYPSIKSVGPVSGISFASVAVFTGLATTQKAVAAAKGARANLTSTNNYGKKMIEFMSGFYIKKKPNFNNDYIVRIWRSIGHSWDETCATVENRCCAAFRKEPKVDAFFKGQDNYTLLISSHCVQRCTYGTICWKQFHPQLWES